MTFMVYETHSLSSLYSFSLQCKVMIVCVLMQMLFTTHVHLGKKKNLKKVTPAHPNNPLRKANSKTEQNNKKKATSYEGNIVVLK